MKYVKTVPNPVTHKLRNHNDKIVIDIDLFRIPISQRARYITRKSSNIGLATSRRSDHELVGYLGHHWLDDASSPVRCQVII